jgi:hypothetical protein
VKVEPEAKLPPPALRNLTCVMALVLRHKVTIAEVYPLKPFPSLARIVLLVV